MGKKLTNAPKIFNVNWFRTDENGKFIWPGFGDNLRVLDWIIDRCEDAIDARETAIGYVPYAKDINLEGTDVSAKTLEGLLEVDKKQWQAEAESIEEHYKKFGDRLPKELREELAGLKDRVAD